jgi:hypothetical protein
MAAKPEVADTDAAHFLSVPLMPVASRGNIGTEVCRDAAHGMPDFVQDGGDPHGASGETGGADADVAVEVGPLVHRRVPDRHPESLRLTVVHNIRRPAT